MKYIVQAAHITNIYDVKNNKNCQGEYISKPEFVAHKQYKWENILSFECDHLEKNEPFKPIFYPDDCRYTINISKVEEIGILGKIFRADNATTYLLSNKVLTEIDDTETFKSEYYKELYSYCNYIIEKYPEVKEQCDIYPPTDILKNIDKIKDKIIKVKKKYTDTKKL